ncbi:Uncharacterized conserved protein, DUF58 family, contains vWF domain [Salinimicrobium sediminis]|uniref:Uncharacterized conserved protein, DUF58 family, contains vWF domain n=3 Tax=Flavobacteriaceae TaxID=49546 RepID=A0A285X9D8_9FLAO|nr:DUF58 domain-containing protein [Salinimicrobium sediminis]SOC81394.1 Uncharacterized conserved protein, DUF58 family, contains vWF domain [Salinimicrobium sediminis]
MLRFFKSLYLHQRFFVVTFTLAAGFLFSYWFEWLYPILWLLTIIFLLIVLVDVIALFKSRGITAERILPEKFSNSDENRVQVMLQNHYGFKSYVEIIDEIPVQFQKRDFLHRLQIAQQSASTFNYSLRPVERGEYYFGNLNVFASTPLKLVKRRQRFQKEQMVKVYPSFIQMKKYDFMAIDRKIAQPGLKKIRKIGHTMEFEQIRDYVLGDDVRSINWKATAKQGDLMVNQYQDERSQPVYSVIDTGRTMKMPFNHLKLLDYAVNSALAFSNIALKKKDKAGLITFSNKMEKVIPASSKKTHLNLLLETLYNVNTRFNDSDFGLLYTHANRRLPQRSLLLLYTNFEHLSALHRQLPYLLALARKHLLVVIFFENTELESFIGADAEKVGEIFDQTIAEQFSYDKRLMAKELQKHGIQTILTKPEDLTVNTINKYLEIKKRGIL